jgi:hypothetical protein
MHFSSSTTAMSSSIANASTGHESIQAAQPIQVSLSIFTAIFPPSFILITKKNLTSFFSSYFFSGGAIWKLHAKKIEDRRKIGG